MNKFGSRLKELRIEKEYTQLDLSKILNVHKGTISNWENGNRFPDETMLLKIARLFEVSTDYLLGNTDNKNQYIVDSVQKANRISDEILKILVETGEITEEEAETGIIDIEKKEKLIKKVKKAIEFTQEFDKI